jgi:hypothetical protein
MAVPPGIKAEILDYYADLELPFSTKKNASAWAALQQDLVTMRTMPTSTEPIPYATYGDGTGEEVPQVPPQS